MPDFISVDNAPSLIINGAYEEATPAGEDPIGWLLRNVAFAAPAVAAGDVCPVNLDLLLATNQTRNSWYREVSPQKQPGYRSFLNMTVAADYLEIMPHLFNRMGFNPFNIGQTRVPPFTPAFNQSVIASYFDDLDYTVTFSIEVLGGKGRIETYQAWQGGTLGTPIEYAINEAGLDATTDKDLVVTQLGTGGWQRLTFTGRFGWFTSAGSPARVDQYLLGPVLRFIKQSQDAFTFRITAFSVVRGHYTEIPYAGDLSYLMEPRGMIYLSYGGQCPPGFREATMESTFLKVTSQDDVMSTGGSETHVHTIPVDTVNQAVSSGFKDQAQKEITRTDDHSHPVGEGISVPPSRSVAVCVKY